MIKLLILHAFAIITRRGVADKTRDFGAMVLRSNPVPISLFIFKLKNTL